jgi:hypothetical protein
MPRCELEVTDDAGKIITYIKYFSPEGLTIIVKDKFMNWCEFVVDFIYAKIKLDQISLMRGKENCFLVHRRKDNKTINNHEGHNCEDH